MLIFKIFLFILAFSLCRSAEFSMTKNANNYGPFVISIKKWEPCKGPKATNITTVLVKQNEKNPVLLTCNITLDVPVRLSEVKVNVWHVEGLKKSSLWNYKIDKPCQHFAIARWLSMYLSMQQNCIVKKGQYISNMNVNTMTNQFLGRSFFYGEFRFKSVVLSNQGNFLCFSYNLLFTKKNTTND